MSAAHTPGPWRYKPHSVDSNYMLIFCSSEEGDGDNLRGYCGEANARLIAAAPELAVTLAAVADYWAGGDAPPELEQRIYAALRAAGVRP